MKRTAALILSLLILCSLFAELSVGGTTADAVDIPQADVAAVGAEPSFITVSVGDTLETLKTYLESDGSFKLNITADLDARIGDKGDDNAPYVPYWCTLGQGTKVLNLNGHKLTLANDKQLHNHRTELVMTMFRIPAGAELVINDTANNGEISYDGALAELHHQEGYDDYGRYEQNRDLIAVQGGKLTVNGGRLIAGRSDRIRASNTLIWNHYYRQINGCAIDMTEGEVEIRGGVIYGRGFSYLFDDRQTRTAAIKASSGSLTIYDGEIQGMGCADVMQIGSGADVSIYGGNYRTHKQDDAIVSFSWSYGADHSVTDENIFATSYGSVGIPSRAIRDIGVKTTVYQQDNGFLTADDMQDEPLNETSKNVVIYPVEEQSGSMFAWSDEMDRFDLMPVIAEYTWDKKSPLKFQFQHPFYYPALRLRSFDSIQSYTHSVTAAALRTSRDGMNYVPSLAAQDGRDWVDLNDLPQDSKDKLAVGQTYWLRLVDQELWNNGNGQNTVTYLDDKYITIRIVAPERLSEVACKLETPMKNNRPDMNPTAVESDKYSVELIKWFYRLDGGVREYEIGPEDTFVPGRYYTARLKFTGKNGYAVTSASTATANGWPTESMGDGVFDAEFMVHEGPTPISVANCFVTLPVGGEKPDFSAVSDDDGQYGAEVAKWSIGSGARETDITADSVFAAGNTYNVYVRFTAKSGYTFDDSTRYRINRRQAASNGRGLYIISYTAAEPEPTVPTISAAACVIDEPIGGEKPVYTALSANDAQYGASVGYWYVGVGRTARVMGHDETFTAGETYTAYVRFEANGDYAFTDGSVYSINGRTPTKDVVRGVEYCCVTFTAEAPAPVLGDVDRDGKTDIFDASSIQKSIAGMNGYPKYDAMNQAELAFRIADIDRNGIVDIFDASLIQKFIAGDTAARQYGIGEALSFVL